ncbi:MAG: PKD domain-containing protein, partial [bacterium]
DGGYMRIPYYCNQIGYAACYVDYRGGASFVVDTAGGWAPVDIQFTATSGVEVDAWLWDFGDGESSVEQNPVHSYDDPGYFDVTLNAIIGGDTLSRTRTGCVSAIADTMFAENVELEPAAPAVVVISATNFVPLQQITIPVQFTGTLNLDPGDFTWTTVGCRTEGLDYQQLTHFNPAAKQITFRLENTGASSNIPAGSGPILKIFFSVVGAPIAGQEAVINISGYSSTKQPEFVSTCLEYAPEIRNGLVSVSSCCLGMRGNVDGDDLDNIDIADLVYLVSYMFSGGAEPPCIEEANIDGDVLENIDITDLIHLVNYMFNGGPDPVACF